MHVTIALDAGHGLNVRGKRCDKSLDPYETREWWLNNRVAEYVETELSKKCNNYSVFRTDDPTGIIDVTLQERYSEANRQKATCFVSIHHNAGANCTNAGGIVVYTKKNASTETMKLAETMYYSLIHSTGLKGNRSLPLNQADFTVIKYAKCPALLLELGFMDSKVDVPIILTEDYAKKCAAAIVEALIAFFDMDEKEEDTTIIYRVQVGAFTTKRYAENLRDKLKSLGYQSYITTKGG